MNKFCLGYSHQKCDTCQNEKNWQTLNRMPNALRLSIQSEMLSINIDKCRLTQMGEYAEISKSGSVKFRFIEFNHRRWLRGADAARVAVIDTDRATDGTEEWLWMNKSDIRMNIYMFGNDPELIKANEAYMKGGAA